MDLLFWLIIPAGVILLMALALFFYAVIWIANQFDEDGDL